MGVPCSATSCRCRSALPHFAGAQSPRRSRKRSLLRSSPSAVLQCLTQLYISAYFKYCAASRSICRALAGFSELSIEIIRFMPGNIPFFS